MVLLFGSNNFLPNSIKMCLRGYLYLSLNKARQGDFGPSVVHLAIWPARVGVR